MTAFITILVLIAGLCFGSFITCVSWRLPRNEDVVVKPSYCPSCNAKLTFRDLFPVLSWLASRGACRHCKAKVSARYPLIELCTGILFLLVYMRYGLTLQCALLLLLVVCLMIMIVVDLEHYIIPDEVQWVMLALGVAYRFATGTPVEEILGGFALGLGIGLSLCYGYRFLRHKDGLGFGDVKFLAVAGIWLGIRPMVPFLFYSGLLGIITGLLWRACGFGKLFPFGPALALALLLCVAAPEVPNLFWNIGKWVH
jgi:leader peptidase (prepilin peptidase)/N-methyltransferase